VSGGVVAYLQRSNPSLLENSAFAPSDDRKKDARKKTSMPAEPLSAWRLAGPLWIRLALLMLLTPLGILAAGTAWGEWSASDFSNHEARQKIASSSGNVALPAGQPRGLQRLSSVWAAPFPQYAPSFVRRPAFGYVMSAMFGSGLILATFLLMGWLFVKPDNAVTRGSP
jgi:cobalt/nickel transport system permease protein